MLSARQLSSDQRLTPVADNVLFLLRREPRLLRPVATQDLDQNALGEACPGVNFEWASRCRGTWLADQCHGPPQQFRYEVDLDAGRVAEREQPSPAPDKGRRHDAKSCAVKESRRDLKSSSKISLCHEHVEIPANSSRVVTEAVHHGVGDARLIPPLSELLENGDSSWLFDDAHRPG